MCLQTDLEPSAESGWETLLYSSEFFELTNFGCDVKSFLKTSRG